jgi:myo-inositol-1(or 4)-monophosphatase
MTSTLPAQEIDRLKAFACQLADAAAEVSMRYFRQPFAVDDKDKGDGFDPVTLADQGAEKAIRALIEEHFPDHGIFGEEFGIKTGAGEFEWVLDPIDGTRAFISGLPTWGTLIALKYQDEPLIGVIDQPYLKERYLGWTTGASLNGTPISTRTCPRLSVATLSTTDANLFTPEERPLFDQVLNSARLTRYGMDCYAYAIVASGHMDVIIESGLKPYDLMALIPVVRGAGGVMTNWHGDSPTTDGRLVAIGDPALKDEVLSHLNSAPRLKGFSG